LLQWYRNVKKNYDYWQPSQSGDGRFRFMLRTMRGASVLLEFVRKRMLKYRIFLPKGT